LTHAFAGHIVPDLRGTLPLMKRLLLLRPFLLAVNISGAAQSTGEPMRRSRIV